MRKLGIGDRLCAECQNWVFFMLFRAKTVKTVERIEKEGYPQRILVSFDMVSLTVRTEKHQKWCVR
jgi:hypothetical protein